MPVTGVDHLIRGGGYEARVASVGASLRALRFEGRDLVLPFETDAPRPAMSGAVLAPWPNRLADGSYVFGGERHRLPLTEPELRNAAHGLVAWQHFECTERSDDAVTLRTRIEAQPGYPWPVRVEVRFSVSASGFRQSVTATNEGAEAAPVGLGVHPYLVVDGGGIDDDGMDGGGVDDWVLEVPARSVLVVSEDRLLPVGLEPVDRYLGGALDHREGRAIGATVLNHAFGDLEADGDGRATVRLSNAHGRGVALTVDSSVKWLQVYTADGLPGHDRRRALAVEPMTCPPDAFNSGTDLHILPPGGETSLGWGLRARDRASGPA